MAKEYRLSLGRKMLNALTTASVRAGVGDKRYHLLTVRGRKSGRPLSLPVIVQTFDGNDGLSRPMASVRGPRTPGRQARERSVAAARRKSRNCARWT